MIRKEKKRYVRIQRSKVRECQGGAVVILNKVVRAKPCGDGENMKVIVNSKDRIHEMCHTHRQPT